MSIAPDVVARLRSLLFRAREERELAEELRTHVEMEAEHQRTNGLTDVEARRRSVIALGGVEQVKEDVRDARGTRLMQDGAGDLSYALRTLRRSPGFAAVVILTLAIGIGGTTAVFSAVDTVLLQPLPYQQSGALVRLYQSNVSAPESRNFVSPVHYVEYRTQMSSFESAAAILTYDDTGADIGTGDNVRRIRLLPTSANYFDVMRVQPAIGHGFRLEDEDGTGVEDNVTAGPVVVISHELWKQQLQSDPAVVGKTLVMSGRPYVIDGVMPAGFKDPIAGAIDAWVPIDLLQGHDPREAGNHYLTVIARLRAGTPIARAQAELDGLSVRLQQQYPNAKTATAHLYSLKEDIVGSSSRALEIMLGAVGLVLILVCVNIANLMLVRGSERTREFALRSALGARSSRLIRQLLTESLTLAVAGAVAGMIVARLAMSAIVAIGSGSIPRLASLSLDPRLLIFALLLATLCAVLFGLIPAVRAARTQPGEALRDQSRSATSGGRSMRLREWLVVSQVAVAFVLLVGAGLLLASFQQIRQVPLGVKAEGVLTFELNLPAARYDSTARAQFYEAFAQQAAAIPGVRAVGGVSRLPGTGAYHSWGVTIQTGPLAGDEKRRNTGADNRVISGEYFKAAGIPIIEGRGFTAADDATAPDRVVISKSLATAMYPGVSAVGQRLRTGGRSSEVIGVVGDVAVDNEGHPAQYVYHAHRQFAGDRNWALTQLIATTGDPTRLEGAVRRTLALRDPQLVMFRPVTFDAAIGRGAAQRVFTLKILLTFAAVALALSALGLFGVLSYGVKLRSREFGIRMALGAERNAIRGMVMRQGLTVTAVGIGVGLLGALGLSRLMVAVLFHVNPLDPLVLVGAVLFMAVIAAIACFLPAHRATSVDPRSALQ